MNEFIDALEGELLDAARRRAAARPRRRVRLPRLPLRPLAAGALASAFVAAGVAALDRRPDERAVVPAAPAGECAPSAALREAVPALRLRDPDAQPSAAVASDIAALGLGDAARRFAVQVPAPSDVDVWLVPGLPCDGADAEAVCVLPADSLPDACAATPQVRADGKLGFGDGVIAGTGPEHADAVVVIYRQDEVKEIGLSDGAFAERAPADAEFVETEWAYRGRIVAAGGDPDAAKAQLRRGTRYSLFAPTVEQAPAQPGSYVAFGPGENVRTAAEDVASTLDISDLRPLQGGGDDDIVVVLGED